MKVSHVLPAAFAGAALAQNTSLVDVIGEQDDLSVLGELLGNNTSILESLQSASNITILAPTNEALEGLINSTMLQESDDMFGLVTAVLMYHVLNGTYFSDNVTDTPVFLPTMLSNSSYANVTDGQVVEAVVEGDTVSFYSALKSQANVSEADIEFDGGVIHIINEVLMIPMNLSATAIEGGLSAAVGALNMTEQTSALEELEDITVFVPNNDAFAAIGSIVGNLTTEDLSGILGYHVINGTVAYSSDLSNMTAETLGGEEVEITVSEDGEVYVNAARVVVPDILIANGVVHVIDSVLNPNGTEEQNEPNPSSTVPAFSDAATATDGGIALTSGIPEPTSTGTDLNSDDGGDGEGEGEGDGGDDDSAAPRAAATIGLGALLGGAAMLLNAF